MVEEKADSEGASSVGDLCAYSVLQKKVQLL